MEIERKFLIKEKTKVYPCPFKVEDLKKEIKEKGKKIVQHYLPEKFSHEILETLGIRFKFNPRDFRIRKYGKNFFITVKSSGKMKRKEVEKKIPKEAFEILEKLKVKTIEKVRLKKRFKNKIIEFDYYPKHSLITAEIEFKSLSEAKKFKTVMREITGNPRYINQNLAE